jgi:hypothetical protein
MFMMVGACMPPEQVSDHGPRDETPPPIGALGLALFLHAAHRSRVTCGSAFSRYRQQAKRYSHVYTRFSV